MTRPLPWSDGVRAWLVPAFSAPRVAACMSTRLGGVSVGPWAGLNLRPGLGDDPDHVDENRRRWERQLGVPTRRVDQVHGVEVAWWDSGPDVPTAAWPVADACATSTAGMACEIQVADCLPILLADREGRAVAAVHAGWRGLAGGVIDRTVQTLSERAGVQPSTLEAWLGPCIGPTAFEVGEEVRDAFATAGFDTRHFRAGVRAGKCLADLAGLARDRLQALGVSSLLGNDSGPDWCTVGSPDRFFSYRRDGVTGRMAAAIWLIDDPVGAG